MDTQRIIEACLVIICSAVLFLKNNGILKEIKSRNYKQLTADFHKLADDFREQRLDLLKLNIYMHNLPLIDKFYNYNEYISRGGNHGVNEYMKGEIIKDKDLWWKVYERDRPRIMKEITDPEFKAYYDQTIQEIKICLK